MTLSNKEVNWIKWYNLKQEKFNKQGGWQYG